MRAYLLALLVAFSGFMALPAHAAGLPAEVEANSGFMTWYKQLADAVAHDKKYNRIPLDTDDKANAFVMELYKLYTRQSDDVEFFVWMDMNYPKHEYEQLFIVNNLAIHRH